MTTTAYAGIDGHLNFSIPKVKRKLTKDNLTRIEFESRDAQEIVSIVERSYLEPAYTGKWSLDAMDTVVNKQLQESYRRKKLELKDEGRHSKDLTDQYMFMACKDPFLAYSIAKNGLQVKEKKDKILNALGNSKSGVSLWKHADVQLCFAETYPLITICKLIVFKVIMGKVKSVQPCYGSETGIEPTPNYDCHISAVSARAGDPFYPKLMKSQIFFYEYTDEALPAPCPRQCLPYAILTYKRPKHCAPVDHHSLKRNFFRSGKDRAEPGAQGPVSGEDASSYTDTTPGRYRAGSQHHRHNSGEADPRLSPSGTSIGRGRGAPLLPDPSLTIQQASTPDSGQPWSSGQNYPAPGLQSSSLYRRPLLQTPTLASATSDTTLSEGGHPLGPQRFVEDPRLACRSSQTSSASCSEQSYGDLERPLVMESPPVTGVTAEMCVLKVHQVEESSYQSITNSSKCTDMNTAVYANGLKSTEPQTLLNSRTTVAVSIPPLLPSAHLQHVNVSKVQESLTESQVAMLKQALNTSHVVSPMNLLSQQLAGEGLMSPGLSCSVTQGQTPLSSPLQKPKAGKQKLSLESYRQKKRKASSGQSANLSSDNQISGQSPQGSTLVPQQQQLTSDSVTCAEESSDFANLNPPQIEPEHPTLPVKGILKTRKASVEDISPVDDARMDQDTSVVVSELKDKHSLALQAPGSPCSVISSVSSIDGSSVTSSLSSNLAGSVTHSPAQADHKKNTQPKKKKKVNRMMMGYKKRRKRKRKSKSTTKADEVKEADDSVCDLEGTSPSTDCLTKVESERSLPPQPKSRSNPLWNLASPPNDNDIDYNDFSYEQPHHFEMSIPDGLSPPPPLPAKRACLDLHRFGINHWSEAATDPRFQPSVLLVRSKVDAQTSIVSVPKDEDLLFDCPDSPDCASLVMVSDEKPSDMVRNTEIAVVKGPQRDTGCEGVADVGTEGICESDTTCEAFNVKPVPDDCNTQLSENNPAEDTRVTAKRTSVIDSNMYDVGEIEAAIDRHIKQSHAEDMYPKWPGITHPDLSKPVLCPGKRSTSQSTTQTSESVLCESGMEVSMDIIHRVAANILPYMEGNHSVSEISSTIAAILSPLPLPQSSSLPVPARTSLPVPAPTSLPVPAPTLLPVSVPTSLPVQTLLNLPTALPVPVQTSLPLLTSLPVPAPTSLPVPTSLHEPASLTVPMSVPVTVPETCEKPVYPLESTENTMISPASPGQDYDSTSIALAILHEDSDDDDIFNPQPSPAKSDSNPAPSDDLYSAYIPESTHKTTNSESAEQTAAKWLGQMAQLCNMRKEEPEKTQLDFFESVRKTLNLNIRVHSAALPEEIPQVKTEKKNVSPEPEILTGASLVKPLTVKAEAELQIEVEKESQWDLKQCEETESTDQNIPVLSRVKQETFKHERKRPDKTIPVVSGAKCHRTVRDAQTGKNKQKNGKQVVVLTAAESEHNLSEGYESSTALNIHPDQIKPEVVKDSCQDTGLPPGDKHDQSDILRWFQDMITPKPGEKSQLINQTSNKNKTGVDRQLDRQSSADASQFENSVKEKVTNDIRSSEKGRSSRDSATVSNSERLSKRRHSLHSVSSSPSPGRGLVRQKSRRSPSDEGRYCDSATRTARSSSYASSRLSEREHHRYRSPSDSPRYCSGRRYSRNSYSRSRSHSPRRRHSGHSSSSGTSRHGSRTSSRSCSRSPDRRSDLLRRSPICRNRYRRKGRWSSSSRSFSRSHTPDSDREKKPLYRRSSICSPVSRRSSSSSPGRRVRDRSRSNSRSRYTRHSQGEWAPSQSSGTRSRKSPGTPVRRLRRQSSSQKSQSPGPLKHSEEIRHTVKRNSSPSLRRRSHRVSSRDKFPSDARQDGHDECCEGSDLRSGDEKEGCLSSVIVSHRVRRSSCDKTEERRSSVGYFKIENHDYDSNEAIQEKKATREGVCYGQDKIIPVSLCMSQVAVLSTVLNSSGSPVRQFEAKTLDDLDSERARLLLELDDLKNSDSDTASVISHYSKASNCSHGNKKLSPVQKNTKFEEEKAVADGKQIKLESKSSNASILTPETFRSEMTNSSCLPNAILESQQGLLQNFGSSQSPEPYYSQPQRSNLQTPVIAESWSSIMCNIENEKQEVVRGHTLNVSKVEQTQTLPGTVSENVPDMFQLECKTALNKMEKLKRKQEGQRAQALFNSPLHTWLSLFIPSSSNVYDEVLQEICRCMKLPRTKIFSGLSKKSRKATRKIADRLARICTAMEGTSDKIKTSTSISMDSPSSAGSYYTVKDWFATFINPGAKYFNAVVEDALLSLDISPFYKITSLPNEHCSQLRNRAEFYRKLWEKLNLPSYTDSSGSVNCTEQSTESDIQQQPLSKAQKPVENLNEGNYCYRVRNYSVPTTSLQETVLCDSCGKNPDTIGLNLAIKNLKEVKTSVERAAAYLKEYVGHMKIVLWNAKAFQSIRFSLDKSRGLLSTVNAFSSPIKRHFCDLAPAYENLVKVIGFSKYFFFKSRKVQIELVISSLKAVLEILDSAILSATCSLGELQVPEINTEENHESCNQCFHYIHTSLQSTAASDFISLEANQSSGHSSNNMYSPSEPTSEHSSADEQSQIPKFNFNTSWLLKDILATFERLKKTFENGHLDCSWKGTRMLEEITEKLLLPDEMRHGILYGGQGIWLQQTLSKKKYYQLMSFRGEILRINQLLQKYNERKLTLQHLQRSKRKMLNKRWNVFSIYTDKLSHASLQRLQDQSKILNECLLCLESARYPEIQTYKTDEMRERLQHLVERIPAAIELCQKGLAKLEEKQSSDRQTKEELISIQGSPLGSASEPLLHGSVCEPLGGEVKTSQSVSEMHSSLEDMDADASSTSGFQDEVSVWAKGAGPDPPHVKVTYFSSTNSVLEPSDHVLEKIAPRNDHTRWALAAALKSESSPDTRPVLVSSPRNDDTRRALATNTDVRATVYEESPTEDIDMRRTTEPKREILKFHVKGPSQKGIGRGRFQPNQHQGKPISSIGGQTRRPAYHRSYKQNSALYRSSGLLRNCSGRDAHVPVVQRYPFAVEEQSSCVHYYPNTSYNNYPPHQSNLVCMPNYGMPGNMPGNMPVGNPALAYTPGSDDTKPNQILQTKIATDANRNQRGDGHIKTEPLDNNDAPDNFLDLRCAALSSAIEGESGQKCKCQVMKSTFQTETPLCKARSSDRRLDNNRILPRDFVIKTEPCDSPIVCRTPVNIASLSLSVKSEMPTDSSATPYTPHTHQVMGNPRLSSGFIRCATATTQPGNPKVTQSTEYSEYQKSILDESECLPCPTKVTKLSSLVQVKEEAVYEHPNPSDIYQPKVIPKTICSQFNASHGTDNGQTVSNREVNGAHGFSVLRSCEVKVKVEPPSDSDEERRVNPEKCKFKMTPQPSSTRSKSSNCPGSKTLVQKVKREPVCNGHVCIAEMNSPKQYQSDTAQIITTPKYVGPVGANVEPLPDTAQMTTTPKYVGPVGANVEPLPDTSVCSNCKTSNFDRHYQGNLYKSARATNVWTPEHSDHGGFELPSGTIKKERECGRSNGYLAVKSENRAQSVKNRVQVKATVLSDDSGINSSIQKASSALVKAEQILDPTNSGVAVIPLEDGRRTTQTGSKMQSPVNKSCRRETVCPPGKTLIIGKSESEDNETNNASQHIVQPETTNENERATFGKVIKCEIKLENNGKCMMLKSAEVLSGQGSIGSENGDTVTGLSPQTSGSLQQAGYDHKTMTTPIELESSIQTLKRDLIGQSTIAQGQLTPRSSICTPVKMGKRCVKPHENSGGMTQLGNKISQSTIREEQLTPRSNNSASVTVGQSCVKPHNYTGIMTELWSKTSQSTIHQGPRIRRPDINAVLKARQSCMKPNETSGRTTQHNKSAQSTVRQGPLTPRSEISVPVKVGQSFVRPHENCSRMAQPHDMPIWQGPFTPRSDISCVRPHEDCSRMAQPYNMPIWQGPFTPRSDISYVRPHENCRRMAQPYNMPIWQGPFTPRSDISCVTPHENSGRMAQPYNMPIWQGSFTPRSDISCVRPHENSGRMAQPYIMPIWQGPFTPRSDISCVRPHENCGRMAQPCNKMYNTAPFLAGDCNNRQTTYMQPQPGYCHNNNLPHGQNRNSSCMKSGSDVNFQGNRCNLNQPYHADMHQRLGNFRTLPFDQGDFTCRAKTNTCNFSWEFPTPPGMWDMGLQTGNCMGNFFNSEHEQRNNIRHMGTNQGNVEAQHINNMWLMHPAGNYPAEPGNVTWNMGPHGLNFMDNWRQQSSNFNGYMAQQRCNFYNGNFHNGNFHSGNFQ